LFFLLRGVPLYLLQRGWTALHVAAKHGYVDIIKKLAFGKADLNVTADEVRISLRLLFSRLCLQFASLTLLLGRHCRLSGRLSTSRFSTVMRMLFVRSFKPAQILTSRIL
jgi:hypothetical protein